MQFFFFHFFLRRGGGGGGVKKKVYYGLSENSELQKIIICSVGKNIIFILLQ